MPCAPEVRGPSLASACVPEEHDRRHTIAGNLRAWAHACAFACIAATGATQAQEPNRTGNIGDGERERYAALVADLRAQAALPPGNRDVRMLEKENPLPLIRIMARNGSTHELAEALMPFLIDANIYDDTATSAARLFPHTQPSRLQWKRVLPNTIERIDKLPYAHAAIRTLRNVAHAGITAIGPGDPELRITVASLPVYRLVGRSLQLHAADGAEKAAVFLREAGTGPRLWPPLYRSPFLGPQPWDGINWEHEDYSMRMHAHEGLSLLGEHGARQAALLLRGQFDAEIRLRALETLSRIGRAGGLVRDTVESVYRQTRNVNEVRLSSQVLAHFIDEPTVASMLFERIDVPAVAEAVCTTCDHRYEAELLRAIETHLQKGHGDCQRQTALLRLLCRIEKPLLAERANALLPHLLQQLVPEGHTESIPNPLHPLQTDPEASRRIVALRVMGNTGKGLRAGGNGDAERTRAREAYRRALVGALRDPDLLVRAKAAEELAGFARAAVDCLPALRQAAQSTADPAGTKAHLERRLVLQRCIEEALRTIDAHPR